MAKKAVELEGLLDPEDAASGADETQSSDDKPHQRVSASLGHEIVAGFFGAAMFLIAVLALNAFSDGGVVRFLGVAAIDEIEALEAEVRRLSDDLAAKQVPERGEPGPPGPMGPPGPRGPAGPPGSEGASAKFSAQNNPESGCTLCFWK